MVNGRLFDLNADMAEVGNRAPAPEFYWQRHRDGRTFGIEYGPTGRATARSRVVIDDSPTIVALLRRMLLQNGFEVLEAGDAEAGLEIARSGPLDLLFLDIVLPGMNGFEALRRLRRDPATRDLPVVMISGNELATEQFYAQRIGADDFMKKPFSRSEVFHRIERLLGPDRIPHRPPPGTVVPDVPVET
jgi:CheY-like chemotaxis protein